MIRGARRVTRARFAFSAILILVLAADAVVMTVKTAVADASGEAILRLANSLSFIYISEMPK